MNEKTARELDPRARRTQTWLGEALIALSAERGYNNVTIKALTERANVGYATFFRHYHDKDELMLEILEDEVNTLLAMTTPDIPADQMTAKQREQYFMRASRVFFERADQHRTLYHILLTNPGTYQVVRRVKKIVADHILRIEAHLLDYVTGGIIPADALAHHVAGSILILIEWWLEQDQVYTAERMSEIYTAMIVDPWNVPTRYARQGR